MVNSLLEPRKRLYNEKNGTEKYSIVFKFEINLEVVR